MVRNSRTKDAHGSYAAYLRHGIGHAALAFPIAAAAAAKTTAGTAAWPTSYNVEVIEFVRPGGMMSPG